MGLSIDDLLVEGTTQIKTLIKQRIQDIERQRDIAQSPLFRAPIKTRYVMRMANYLSQLEDPAYRRAFTLARCSVIPSRVLEGRYKKIPYEDRRCTCSQREAESMVHMFFCCPFHHLYRERFIHPCLDRLTVETNEMGDHKVGKSIHTLPLLGKKQLYK
ncbi:hypothetical protein JRQ81_017311 [Phrynocephalus forsythii]|uniref:Uncharacterized protein n=1 Tax=Phrynocephalus forsythii TaxID=171643 RepID=A0A9Q0XQ44_9SAUR|nr:hypothetical protein JRQ81_017311 [Phrynocephalus forsythii]